MDFFFIFNIFHLNGSSGVMFGCQSKQVIFIIDLCVQNSGGGNYHTPNRQSRFRLFFM